MTGQTAYCGAVIWRNKYSLGASGGHADSYDDGHYAQDLATGRWEMLLPPSTMGTPSQRVDVYGEWLPNRPAAQHSGPHQVTVGDDIVLAVSYSIGYQGTGSGQAHRWNGAAGAWERYGNLRAGPVDVHNAIYDAKRNRIVLIQSATTSVVYTITANDKAATWTSIGVAAWPPAGLYQSIGYHEVLDCFVMIDQEKSPNRVWVMDPDRISSGWTEVAVRGSAPTPMTWSGLEYIPPMQVFAAANMSEANALYYLARTGGRFDAWAWHKETFSGSVTPARWEKGPGAPDSPQTRVKWSSYFNALVMVKSPGALTEIFTPSSLR